MTSISSGRAAVHLPCRPADLHDDGFAIIFANRHNRGFLEHDAPSLLVYENVDGAQINGDIRREDGQIV
jgi:hypothetical protein